MTTATTAAAQRQDGCIFFTTGGIVRQMGGKGSGRKSTGRVTHGTVSSYASGCRCAACRAAWRDYFRTRRDKQQQAARYYDVPSGGTVAVSLSPLSHQILEAAQARTEKTPRDIVEHLLRLYGGAVEFVDPPDDAAA